MPIKLNGATSGSVELDVPAAVGSDLQLTLPTAAGTLDRLERAGNILQVVSNVTATEQTIASSSFQDTGVFENITSKQANSKFMVFASLQYRVFKNSGDTGSSVQLVRNVNGGSFSNLVTDGNDYAQGYSSNVVNNLEMSYRSPFHFLDSPNVASGSVLSYKIQVRVRGSGNSVHFQDDDYYVSSLTIFEIAA